MNSGLITLSDYKSKLFVALGRQLVFDRVANAHTTTADSGSPSGVDALVDFTSAQMSNLVKPEATCFFNAQVAQIDASNWLWMRFCRPIIYHILARLELAFKLDLLAPPAFVLKTLYNLKDLLLESLSMFNLSLLLLLKLLISLALLLRLILNQEALLKRRRLRERRSM